MNSILQDWVIGLGLRHQGVLLSGIRGCDTAPPGDASKNLSRPLRAVLLKAHCGDQKKSQSYIESVDESELAERFNLFRKNLDHYPHHYVMHFFHACEIIGYKHPEARTRDSWNAFYLRLCKSFHVHPETESELDRRLNADEETFAKKL